MKVAQIRRLFDTDAKTAIFSAEVGKALTPERLRVCVYPRKSRPGFLYCIWGPGICEIGMKAIVAGGTVQGGLVERAALCAVKALITFAEQRDAGMFGEVA